jgi:hypothetical protein
MGKSENSDRPWDHCVQKESYSLPAYIEQLDVDRGVHLRLLNTPPMSPSFSRITTFASGWASRKRCAAMIPESPVVRSEGSRVPRDGRTTSSNDYQIIAMRCHDASECPLVRFQRPLLSQTRLRSGSKKIWCGAVLRECRKPLNLPCRSAKTTIIQSPSLESYLRTVVRICNNNICM